MSAAYNRTGTPEMDERGAKRKKVDQRVGENGSGEEESREGGEKRG